jgi:hypothetical protein
LIGDGKEEEDAPTPVLFGDKCQLLDDEDNDDDASDLDD